MHFDHGKNKIQIFNFWPSYMLCRGSEVKTNFKMFERKYLFKRGQLEHVLTMANLKLKPSLFTPALLTTV